MIAAIACVDRDFNIGKDNHLLFHIPQDMALFKTLTTNAVVVMGRKTYESIPNRPLKDRINIVLSHDKDYKASAIVINNFNKAVDLIHEYESNNHTVYIIGGAEIYTLFQDLYDILILTQVHTTIYGADSKFKIDDIQSYKKYPLIHNYFEYNDTLIGYSINIYIKDRSI